MKRNFNYTGRRNIAHSELGFTLTEATNSVPEFNVLFNLDKTAYPDDALIFIEAYYRESLQRFEFGTIGKIRPPTDRKLDQIDLSGSILFRVLIVRENGNKALIIGRGDSFRADRDESDPENRASILPIVARDLDQQTWKINFETGGNPELVLNKKIPNVIDKLKTDIVFQALVLPAALREVLMYYVWNEEEENEASDKWLEFAKSFTDKQNLSKEPLDIISWIDDVVEGFTEEFKFCEKLANAYKEED